MSFGLKPFLCEVFCCLECGTVFGWMVSKISNAPHDLWRWRQYCVSTWSREAFPHCRCHSQDDMNFQKHRYYNI
jgi:hypothetical protein